MWNDLNQQHVPDDDPAYSDARRRVLSRLGDYAAQVIAPLKLRPAAATLLSESAERVEVRVSTPGRHIVLVIAPDGDLSAEVFFLRAVAAKSLPAPQMMSYDLSRTVFPFAYALEGYIGGNPVSTFDDGPLLRMVARQLGRTLRRIHSLPAPNFGQPLANGRWPARAWHDVLAQWLERRAFTPRAHEILGAPLLKELTAATRDHPALVYTEPRVTHGAVQPERVWASVGEGAQLEALVQPGAIVGGDPLFDLAHATLPCRPAMFRQGVWEAYKAAGALDAVQQDRLARLRLLLGVADALNRADADELARMPEEVAGGLKELGN